MFSDLIKEINRLRKEKHLLFTQGMSNIDLKVIIEKIWDSQIFGFLRIF